MNEIDNGHISSDNNKCDHSSWTSFQWEYILSKFQLSHRGLREVSLWVSECVNRAMEQSEHSAVEQVSEVSGVSGVSAQT